MAEIQLKVKSHTREVTGIILVQKGAPQLVLIGTNLLGHLGFYLVWQAEPPPEYGSLPEEILEKEKPEASEVVTVKLPEAVRLPARHAKAVAVKLQGSKAAEKLWMLEMWLPSGETEDPATEEAQAIVLEPDEEGEAQVWLELYPVKLSKGEVLGSAEPVEVVAQEEESQGVSVKSSDVPSLSVG